ncbi:MAG: hypothetical protein KDJ65_16835 [Anaerolineae bacterium]|nr:hypothetical protein [Anaerolineae bacterium]
MTVSMIAKHTVDDFATWKKMYNETAQLRKDGGVIADGVHRVLDNPNVVVVYHQFPDVDTAKAFGDRLNTEEFGAIAKGAGIHLDTLEMWLLEDVE